MPEWWIERGIAETRAALVEHGAILEARIELEGVTPAGTRLAARLIDAGPSGRNAVARAADGKDYLLPTAPRGIAEGAAVTIEVSREAIGTELWKRPLARICDEPPSPPLPLEERLGGRLLPFPGPEDPLGRVGWDDLIDEAATGLVTFPGGELRIERTAGMTVIDVDGAGAPDRLAVAGARAAAAAIRRLAIAGSIGIDLPTGGGKAARQEAVAAFDAALPLPFERTAVNGFGFLQIVRPRRHASLLELAADRPGFAARAWLRRMAREGHGAAALDASPAIAAWLSARPELIERLSRQRGGAITLRQGQPAAGS